MPLVSDQAAAFEAPCALRRYLGDPLRVGDVEGDGRHAGLGDGGGMARGPVDLGRAPGDQLPGVHLAEAAVGPGD